MIHCKELNKDFSTKQELFKALKENSKEIISLKKSQVYKSVEKDRALSVRSKKLDVSKVSNEATKEMFSDDSYYYIAVNTTGILDSHGDLHVKGIWNKTAKEQNKRNYLVDTHVMSMNTTIARKEYVEMFVAEIPFSMVGKDYEGNTEALIYKIPKDKVINQLAKEWLDSGDDIEASVRMKYVTVELAFNSDDSDDEVYKRTYDKYVSQVANKNDFESLDYFWVVKEAKNESESSLVLNGSNPATGQLQENKIEPSQDTQETKEAVNSDTSHNYLLI